MASHVLLTPEVRPTGVLDTTPHRAELPRAYNTYRRVGAPGDDDGRELVLRPLHMLCFLLADQLEAEGRHGADQVLLTSASSKTALGLAFELGRAGARVAGLTSARNAGFVRSTGIYDAVATYDELETLDAGVADGRDRHGRGRRAAPPHPRALRARAAQQHPRRRDARRQRLVRARSRRSRGRARRSSSRPTG